ncbi:MAG TPA: hydrogenase formation protein HypD [Methylomusa anaerophila]|uniref:Hydrogenase isoenzymes formation protein HypD n=1 Tax=Methylomusa anaerophila TaxID=1930071 RepID=A0A348AL15_9FIRM|nr:hydrogenase formation protein HypD [Methylomusa anaerophila]BBB91763.1 hydrogenase isoenzymes formation protein HypD [Methylomusa anaerophila]HML88500.1 hydrogenase formation protein HypD [Methylomusa anaerophila]
MNLKTEEIQKAAAYFTAGIERLADGPLRIMEVCGTHTVAIFRAGIRQVLPDNVELVSGPGCPVCVTPNEYLDTAVAYSRRPDTVIATFGDMMKVPGTSSTLLAEKAGGADVRMVYSPLEAVQIAQDNPGKRVIFLAVGFETTAPTAAAAVLAAVAAGVKNFFLLTAHKLVPPALTALLCLPETKVDGFLLPGHVCAITGIKPFEFLAAEFGVPSVIAGFEALDILQGVYMLAKQIHTGQAQLKNQYRRIVPADGNPVARRVMEQVFTVSHASWRGFGKIPDSGLNLNERFRHFDALHALPVEVTGSQESAGCRCGEVLRGKIKPPECPHFGRSCTPENPVGSCMVSVEGSCAAWFKYGAGRWQF